MVLAHAIGGRSDLPLPMEFVLVGAAVVLVVSFVALAFLWKEPRFHSGPYYAGRGLVGPPRWVGGLTGIIGLTLVVGQLVVSLLGLETVRTRPTIAPVTVWVMFWLLIPFASAVVGNWYADLNPWRALSSLFGLGKFERIHVRDRIGLWPAAVLFTVFIWFELIHPGASSPAVLGQAALGYTVIVLLAVAVFGRETGLVGFDVFTTYNRLISAISPLGRDARGRLKWRGWLRSLAVIPEWRGLWVFLVVMIGTVTYDGAAGWEWLRNIPGGHTRFGQTVLLVATVVLVGVAYLAACAAAARFSESRVSAIKVANRFAHTLVPIALGYAFAHYFTLVIFEGQQLIAAVSDPFALGWDLFGTAERPISFFMTSTTPIWYAQATAVVGGHVLAVILAHDRALIDFGRGAVRSQYAMMVLMLVLTSVGLLVQTG